MTDLCWPGDERAGDLMTDSVLLPAMVSVEAAWLAALVGLKVAEPGAADDLTGLVGGADIEEISRGCEDGGNPVIPLVAMLRARLESRNAAAARWVHRGLTSQDVLDTALMLCAGDVVARVREELHHQVASLSRLAEGHRSAVMAGRTLTQHAVPITFGLKAAGWLHGVLDACDDLDDAGRRLPSQFGGAAGSLAAATELARVADLDDPPARAVALVQHASQLLGLVACPPWHTSRAPVTRLGDALVGCTDGWGRIANDVLTLSRPEIAEVREPTTAGRGLSSTMPQKVNPVLSVLIRRAALTAPASAAQLHLAAAGSLDERADGAWHTEWFALRTLARHTVVAASQTSELLAGLAVDVGRMLMTATSSAPDLLAERDMVAALFDDEPAQRSDDLDSYLGATDRIIGDVMDRARRHLEEPR